MTCMVATIWRVDRPALGRAITGTSARLRPIWERHPITDGLAPAGIDAVAVVDGCSTGPGPVTQPVTSDTGGVTLARIRDRGATRGIRPWTRRRSRWSPTTGSPPP